MTNTTRYILSLAFSLACSTSVWAQDNEDKTHSPAARELNSLYFPWLHSDNAAGLVYDTGRYVATFRSAFSHRGGAFKQPEDGRDEKQLSVFSEGVASFANLLTYGSFEYNDVSITEAGYNASILDPHRGMPYYIVDTHESNWRKHNYKLLFKLATQPIREIVTFGLTGRYSALHGAKQRDPRTDNRLMQLELTPAVVFTPHVHHRLGISAGYSLLKEQSHMQNVNLSDSQDFYSLLGLGKSIKGIGSGEVSDYKGVTLSGELCYQAVFDSFMMMFSTGYRRHSETATISFSTPRNRGSVLLDGFRSSLLFSWDKSNILHHLELSGAYSKTKGIEYINIRDTSEEQKGWLQLHRDVRSEYKGWSMEGTYTLVVKNGLGYDWKVLLSTGVKDISDAYLYPRSDYNVRHWSSGLDVARRFGLSDTYGTELILRVRGGYTHNLKGEYSYNDSNPDSPTVKGLEGGRLAYQSASHSTLGGELTLASKLRLSATGMLFTTVGYDHIVARSSELGQRRLFSVSIGYNF